MSEHAGMEPIAPPQDRPPQRARRISPYLAVWTGLGAIALLYVSVALARPDILSSSSADRLELPLPPSANVDSATDEALKEKLARMERDLNAKDPIEPRAAQKQSHLDRIAALEAKARKAEAEAGPQAPYDPFQMDAPEAKPKSDKLDSVATNATEQAAHEIADRLGGAKILNDPTANAANTTTVVKQAVKKAAEDQAKTAATQAVTAAVQDNVKKVAAVPVAKKPVTSTVKAKLPEKKVPAPTKVTAKPAPPKEQKIAAKKPAPKPQIRTGSVGKAASKPISFGPAVVTRATRPIGVRIATGPSVDSLRLSWNAISDRYGPAVGRLQPRYVTGIGAGGLTYDLIAGPFNTQTEASEVCARLHANGARCALGEFTGNAL